MVLVWEELGRESSDVEGKAWSAVLVPLSYLPLKVDVGGLLTVNLKDGLPPRNCNG